VLFKSGSDVQQPLFKSLTSANFVKPKAGAKHELLFIKPASASEVDLLII